MDLSSNFVFRIEFDKRRYSTYNANMTQETNEVLQGQERVRILPDAINRRLLVVKDRSGLQLQDLDETLVGNQAHFGRGTDDYVSMVEVHETNRLTRVLGVREEVRKVRMVIVDGVETEFLERSPKVRNIWVGDYVKLFTPNEAAKIPYAGQTALKWAIINGISPEMVVKANNGLFYPATKNDIVMSNSKK